MVKGNHNVSSSNRISRRPDQQLCYVVITRVSATDYAQIRRGIDTAYHHVRSYGEGVDIRRYSSFYFIAYL